MRNNVSLVDDKEKLVKKKNEFSNAGVGPVTLCLLVQILLYHWATGASCLKGNLWRDWNKESDQD